MPRCNQFDNVLNNSKILQSSFYFLQNNHLTEFSLAESLNPKLELNSQYIIINITYLPIPAV
jgi:hypothetical protein